jgi:hypothetical protein
MISPPRLAGFELYEYSNVIGFDFIKTRVEGFALMITLFLNRFWRLSPLK